MSAWATRLRGAPLSGPWCRQVATLQSVALLAWLAYLAVWAESASAGPSAGRHVWWCMPGMSATASAAGPVVPASAGMWLLMSVAMALPAALPAAEHVAVNSFRRRRSQAVGLFTAAFLGAWLAAGLVAQAASIPLGTLSGWGTFAALAALAAGYELTAFKRLAINRCHRTSPLPPGGRRGTLAVVRFGWLNSSGCVASCGPSMLVMLAAPAAQPAVMIVLAAAMSYGRLTRRPRQGRQRVALLYAMLAALGAIAAV